METFYWFSRNLLTLDFFIIILFIPLLASLVINKVVSNYNYVSKNYLWLLFAAHYLMTIVYMIYAAATASDSVQYYNRAADESSWFNLFETGTRFISFVAWFYVKALGLSYYSVMLIFSFFGFLGVLLFYLAARENISLPKTIYGLSMVEIVFLLPNLHFWSSSIGKGSTILFGLGLLTYGLSRFDRRVLFLVAGSYVVFMVRPHILFALVAAIMAGILITTSGIKWYVKGLILLVAAVAFFSLTGTVTEFTETDSLNILNSDILQHRARELGKSSSGIDLQNYNQLQKLLTFWFRPLFFDGLSFTGLMASFENAFYIFMLFVFIRQGLTNWSYFNGWFRICLIFFLLGSFILAQVSGNLGIAMRQKAQLMPFFFIIFCKAMSFRTENTVRRQYYSPAT